MLPQFFIRLKNSSPIPSIPFITTGILFVLMLFPKFVLAEKAIQHLGPLKLLIPTNHHSAPEKDHFPARLALRPYRYIMWEKFFLNPIGLSLHSGY